MSDEKLVLSEIQAANAKKRGIECAHCGCRDLRVYYTNSRSKYRVIRYRKCRCCGSLYVSEERLIKK